MVDKFLGFACILELEAQRIAVFFTENWELRKRKMWNKKLLTER